MINVAHVGHWTVGISRGYIFDNVWIAAGNSHDRWPGLLFGGIARRAVPKRYADLALQIMLQIVEQIDAGETPTPLPSSYFKFRRLLAQRSREQS
jgi:hypothetical protein